MDAKRECKRKYLVGCCHGETVRIEVRQLWQHEEYEPYGDPFDGCGTEVEEHLALDTSGMWYLFRVEQFFVDGVPASRPPKIPPCQPLAPDGAANWLVARNFELPPILERTLHGETLAEREQNFLVALLELGAFDSDTRTTTPKAVSRAAGKGESPECYKRVVTNLRERGLLKTKQGGGGGVWLTAAGRKRAEKLARPLSL